MPQLATFKAKVPVTVITGFLGSGKTTLVNQLLQQTAQANKVVAVIENEFGEVNIDKTLVGDQLKEREDIVSLDNGCVCCSLRKDIVRAFAELEKRSKTKNRELDHILLETTGLADPSPVAFTFFANPWIAARFKLDSITCVVDAKHLMQHLEDGKHGANAINEAIQQIAFSDLILLNKVDTVTATEKQFVLEAVRRINNTARIIECQLNSETGQPNMGQILGTNTFSVQRALTVDPQFLDTDSDCDTIGGPPGVHIDEAMADDVTSARRRLVDQAQQAAAAAAAEAERCEHHLQGDGTEGASALASKRGRDADPCRCDGLQPAQARGLEKNPKRRRKQLHDLSDISSVGITTKGQLDEYRFNMFMRDLLTEKAKDIFRCKGVLAVHGYGSKKFVFQGVHETICYGPAEVPWQEGEPRINQIVFIGRGLDRKMLTEGFKTCLWQPLPEGWEEAIDDTTKQPYYWNKKTGEKSWLRPNNGYGHHADVISHHASTQQPRGVAPSRMRTAQHAMRQASMQHSPTNSTGGNEASDAAAPAVAVA